MPKKKGKKKGAKGPIVIDGLFITDMTREQVEGHVGRLKDELDREREERNYFQLERDKINTFWEICRQQLEDARCELRNRDRAIEEAEQKHRTEVKIYKQKIKHLHYEHQTNLSTVKNDYHEGLKHGDEEHHQEVIELQKDKQGLREEMREQQLTEQELVRNVRMNHSNELTKQRCEFEREAVELENKYERRQREQRIQLDLQRKTELHELEERKNAQIESLIQGNEKSFSEMKTYYNDVVLNNLALINTLKEHVEELKAKEQRLANNLSEVMAENKRLTEPLAEAEQKLSEMEKKVSSHEHDKQSLCHTTASFKLLTKEHEDLKWENQVLEQRFDQVQNERDQIYQRFVSAISEVQQKASMKSLLLEKKLSTLADVLEKKEAQLSEILAASNLDPDALGIVNRKLEDMLDSKNNAIKDLQYELARMCKTHGDLVHTYNCKLQEYGVPSDNVGFSAIKPCAAKRLSKGPAGVVSGEPI